MSMTRKDYRKIAEEIRNMYKLQDYAGSYIIKTLASNMAVMLKKDNPRFDKNKFIEACEIEYD